MKTSTPNKDVNLNQVTIDNEAYFKISNINEMRPFFMSIVSNSNHWMFISSNGGLTAGRKNAEYALFPYYTDDKITESAEITGSKSIFKVTSNNKTSVWEPLSQRFESLYNTTQNLYKNTYGNKVIFEEVNHDLDLTFRYQWSSSNRYGFVKKSTLINNADKSVTVSVLDGIQNILPYGVGSDLQNASSNLVDAYKRTELDQKTGLGIFALSAIIVDKAEPSEALKANVVWSFGIRKPKYLLSSLQLKAFRKGQKITQETDIKAEKGAYFVNTDITLKALEQKTWALVANVNLDHAAIAELTDNISNNDQLEHNIQKDIDLGTQGLIKLSAAADGLQCTADSPRDTRHFANTLFNIMRGGIFDNNYQIEKWDFKNYLQNANKAVAKATETIVKTLPDVFSISTLKDVSKASDNKSFKRLCLEYMPLKFSRRHGDPSRPWNKFSINTRSEKEGSKILDYEGNWRDIFQNWEALAFSYPEFIESMIHKFLNATTFDGYNPYRVTKGGFDWEISEPNDPWSYIGYWGDHQIIYLLKFLEFIEAHQPGKLQRLFTTNVFVYANVPYIIKGYKEVLKNPKDTIAFNETLDEKIREQRKALGADGALLLNKNNDIITVNFIEKILATTLAKLSNFIPEAGIWMNTQRPEWNDANNALVGNGVSMVTLYYLRRFLKFFDGIFKNTTTDTVELSKELAQFFNAVSDTFTTHKALLEGKINDTERRAVVDGLGKAGSAYRTQIYNNSFSGRKTNVSVNDIKSFVKTALAYLEHSIKANKRKDNLYHAYNLMTVKDNGDISISYLSEMLEGQVAVLSSGYITSKNALKVLDALKVSKLFRADQYSYLLYPYKALKGFLDRNTIPVKAVSKSKFLTQQVETNNTQIITKAVNGKFHFNGNFKNANDLEAVLNAINTSTEDKKEVLAIFEDVFNHKEFTGRSGTFYGYEGLGSIYWHMVSKLLLAVQACCVKAINDKESDTLIGKLLEHYYEINAGIGVHKSPKLYGAFPTDPYSHTPAGKGAQQPGMTGQVKEDILSRFGELGVFVLDSKLHFYPSVLKRDAFLKTTTAFNYINVFGQQKTIQLPKDTLSFTYCQVPVIYKISSQVSIEVIAEDGTTKVFFDLNLDNETSKSIFCRFGEVVEIRVNITTAHLK
ncbi:MAG: hypothetical protein ACPGUH_03640 [Winogradskyella sp.]